MTEIQNSKPVYDFEVFKGSFIDTDKTEMTAVRIANVLVIEYCDLRFICNLVLVIWDLYSLVLVICYLPHFMYFLRTNFLT